MHRRNRTFSQWDLKVFSFLSQWDFEKMRISTRKDFPLSISFDRYSYKDPVSYPSLRNNVVFGMCGDMFKFKLAILDQVLRYSTAKKKRKTKFSW